MKHISRLIVKYWMLLTFGIISTITFLSLMPLPETPDMPGNDKLHHLIAYALLVFPAAWRRPKNRICLYLFFIAYSGAIELIQPFVNRTGEWLDLLANITGIVMGIVSATLLIKMAPGVLDDENDSNSK
jgi:VanZ family protein